MDTEGLIPGAQIAPYVLSDLHQLLAFEGVVGESGIGDSGLNLTIVLLAHEEAAPSVRLVQSIARHIPHLRGGLLISCWGSVRGLDTLVEACSELDMEWEIQLLPASLSRAAARNRAIENAATSWVMFLTQDMYLISNPLQSIQHDVAALGCHFFDLALLGSDERTLMTIGGHLELTTTEGPVRIRPVSAFEPRMLGAVSRPPFLCSLLREGCVFRVDTFLAVGGFTEAASGQEFTDLSVRLFRRGMKIGASTYSCLVDDPPGAAPATRADHESSEYLASRYGLAPPATELPSSGSDSPSTELEGLTIGGGSARPRIALIIDTFGWAFSNIAHQIERYLSDQFEFRIIPIDAVGHDVNALAMMTGDCDLVHFFWRDTLTLFDAPRFRETAELMGFDPEDFTERFVAGRTYTTSVYDHLFLDARSIEERRHVFREHVAGYTVSSQRLFDIYSSLNGYPQPALVVADGVDISRFKPRGMGRWDQIGSRPLVIGWAGNSKWNATTGEDPKGVHSILMPAVERLQAQGLPVVLDLADRQVEFVPHSRMPDYYDRIDLYVCTSETEGTPNPVLEAMASGVPVISTDVGVLPQAFGPLQREWILTDRSVDAFADAISRVNDPEILRALSAENLQSIQEWDWRVRVQGFARFFNEMLSGARGGHQSASKRAPVQ